MISAIGIDIGGTHLRAARVSADGAILSRDRTASSADPDIVLERLEALIARLDDDTVAGIGIGVPGRVDFAARTVLSGGYVDLSKSPLAARLEGRFGHRVVIDNDCSMALLGESAVGAAKGAANVVMLTIGTGIGGAILESGRLLRASGTAGQLGHISIDPNGRLCVCGRRGCVETVSSGSALRRHIAEAGLSDQTTAADLLTRRDAGDAIATGVLKAWAAPLRAAIDSLVATLDPQIVVLGGGLGHAAVAALSGVATPKSWYDALVEPAALGDDAGVIGAALAALPREPLPRRLVLVNGVPASGKSGVAHGLSRVTGWPVLALDTIKNSFLTEIEGIDRPFNRKLGRASMKAMFAILDDLPAGSTMIMDAWFGFQPRDFVGPLIEASGAVAITEIWCTAPPEVIGARYGERTGSRPAGHPGAEYVPELIALAARAEPSRFGPVLELHTNAPVDFTALQQSVEAALTKSRL